MTASKTAATSVIERTAQLVEHALRASGNIDFGGGNELANLNFGSGVQDQSSNSIDADLDNVANRFDLELDMAPVPGFAPRVNSHATPTTTLTSQRLSEAGMRLVRSPTAGPGRGLRQSRVSSANWSLPS